jgi:hypothetical protein
MRLLFLLLSLPACAARLEEPPTPEPHDPDAVRLELVDRYGATVKSSSWYAYLDGVEGRRQPDGTFLFHHAASEYAIALRGYGQGLQVVDGLTTRAPRLVVSSDQSPRSAQLCVPGRWYLVAAAAGGAQAETETRTTASCTYFSWEGGPTTEVLAIALAEAPRGPSSPVAFTRLTVTAGDELQWEPAPIPIDTLSVPIEIRKPPAYDYELSLQLEVAGFPPLVMRSPMAYPESGPVAYVPQIPGARAFLALGAGTTRGDCSKTVTPVTLPRTIIEVIEPPSPISPADGAYDVTPQTEFRVGDTREAYVFELAQGRSTRVRIYSRRPFVRFPHGAAFERHAEFSWTVTRGGWATAEDALAAPLMPPTHAPITVTAPRAFTTER